MNEIVIRKMAFVTYIVKNLQDSRNFYEDIFNLKPGKHTAEYVEYDLAEGGCFTLSKDCFLVRPRIETPNKIPIFNNIAFEVNNLESLVEKLKNKNIRFASKELMDFKACKMSCIFDLDDNVVTLHQLKK